jgi:hypothetical protein
MNEKHQPAVPESTSVAEDVSRCTNLQFYQKSFREILDRLPRVTVNGNRYDIRELTADLIDLFDEVFQSAGLNPCTRSLH